MVAQTIFILMGCIALLAPLNNDPAAITFWLARSGVMNGTKDFRSYLGPNPHVFFVGNTTFQDMRHQKIEMIISP